MPKDEKKEKKEKREKKEKEGGDAPAAEEAAPAPSGGGGGHEEPKKKIGNVFALFNQSQITEFKEAFAMMDNDRDGIIGEDDLASIYQTIGREADPKAIKEMLKESPDKLNFTHFLTLFGEKLHGTDTEQALRDAFTLFDDAKTGKLHEEYFKDLLLNVGDQYSKDEVKQVWKELPIEGGQIDYLKLVTIIKRGKEDE